jgi:Ca-activated chloride channel family protein
MSFDELGNLNLLWIVLLVLAAGVAGLAWRAALLRWFAEPGLLSRLGARRSWAGRLTRLGLVTAALVLLTGALLGPRSGAAAQTVLRRNLDVLILLDVSRSMLARDIAPSRLERAKLAIRDDLLPALGGDRVGLITFAGVPTLVCPLTTDYGFFRLALDDVSTRSAVRGGTNIGDAIRKANESFGRAQLDTHKLVLLITDGEDHGSFALEAARNLWQDQRAPLVALALGDPEQGARIPVAADRGPETYLEHAGAVVRSRADFPGLAELAAISGQGLFVGAGTSNFDLGDIFRSVAGGIRAVENQGQRGVQQPSVQWVPALAALVLLLIEALWVETSRRTTGRRRAWEPEAAR